MSGFNSMVFFYGALIVVPLMLWIIAITSNYNQFAEFRLALAILVGIGSIIFGVIGFKEVFSHGK